MYVQEEVDSISEMKFHLLSKYHITVYFSCLVTDRESTAIMVVWCDGYLFLLAAWVHHVSTDVSGCTHQVSLPRPLNSAMNMKLSNSITPIKRYYTPYTRLLHFLQGEAQGQYSKNCGQPLIDFEQLGKIAYEGGRPGSTTVGKSLGFPLLAAPPMH